MYDSENRIVAREIPRIERLTILVAEQEVRISRADPGVTAGRATIEQGLIVFDAVVVFGVRT
jgi:hypothetical protein